MKKTVYFFVILFSISINTAQNRVHYNNQDLFLSGANLAWLSFANDIGSGTTDFERFGNILLQIHEHGGNSLRWWLHTNGSNSPEFDNEGFVIGPGEYTISDLKTVLDLAWEREVGLKLCLWSFDMLRSNLDADILARNFSLLTDTAYTNAYIKNALIPMVDSLKGHPAIIAWEIFNEPEGMSVEFGWSEIEHVLMEEIQRFINLTAGAIHRTDTLAQVTSGCWSIQAMTDIPTVSLAKKSNDYTSSEKIEITKEINTKYNLSLSTQEVFEHLEKISLLENKNYYSDEALIATGGDANGILDFYSVHYYDWAGTSLSPFHNGAAFWDLDKPIVIAEFHMKNTLGVAKDSLYKTLYKRNYAGALGWSWTDNQVTQPEDMLAGMQYLWDNYQSSVDVIGIGGHWPTISIISPEDGAEFSDTSDVVIQIEAEDTDGEIVLIEIFANDTLKIGDITKEPYTYAWQNIEPGNYNIVAIAIDNANHQRKSNIVRITYGEPPYTRFEAEAATFTGSDISIINDASASSGSYVESRTSTGSITWNNIYNYKEAGSYEIKFGYRLTFDSPKTQFINVNGERAGEIIFEGNTTDWLEESIVVDLKEGENIVEMEFSWGWMDIDYLTVPTNVVTSINDEENSIPFSYMLEQNYPNPFNPTTTIKFTIPIVVDANFASTTTKLVVYNSLGQQVKTLVNEKKSPGNYKVKFDATNLASGVYFYRIAIYSDRITAGSFVQTKKMMLIK